jgi:hypothetical protein
MQKCLFSAPDGPAGPGTIHLVPAPASSASAVPAVSAAGDASPSASNGNGASATADNEATAPVPALAAVDASRDSTAPALVWPPSDEDLDDWHVISLKRPDADGPASTAGANGGASGGSAAPRKPLPAWLANHRAAKSGVGPAGTAESVGTPGMHTGPRAMTPSPSRSAARAVSSPLEDTARFPSDTTTAIAAMRRSSASTGSAPALNLAPAAQPGVSRPVAAFPAERRRPVVARPAPSLWNGAARRTAVVVLALLAVGQAAYIGARLLMTPDAASTSVLTVDSMPDGAEVFIDGERRGVTPFKLELPAGSHALELRKNGRTRTIPLVLAAGVQASQYVELGNAAGSGPSSASPNSAPPSSTPASAAAPRQAAPPSTSPEPPPTTPAPSDGIAAPAAADAGTPPPVPSRGWVVFESGLNLRVLRNGEMLGSSEEGRLALPAGRQELELVNDAVGYRAVMTVQVPPGRALPVPVELPQSVLNISSTPSARVWVDGREVGRTPLAQLALPVGQHEVRFEHPEYGERRMTVLVRVGVTAQAGVDFTR